MQEIVYMYIAQYSLRQMPPHRGFTTTGIIQLIFEFSSFIYASSSVTNQIIRGFCSFCIRVLLSFSFRLLFVYYPFRFLFYFYSFSYSSSIRVWSMPIRFLFVFCSFTILFYSMLFRFRCPIVFYSISNYIRSLFVSYATSVHFLIVV